MAWIRVSKPSYGNKFYNTKSSGGYSSCIPGKYNDKWADRYKKNGVTVSSGNSAPGYSVLPNCVGLASGAFNETYVKNKQLSNPSFVAKEYYALNCQAKSFITQAKKLGLSIRAVSERPPLGGIIVYGSGNANHVAFITKVIDDDTCEIIQSGWGGWHGNYTGWDPVWPSKAQRIYRSKGWEDGNGDGGKCIGFIVNPAVSDSDNNDSSPPPVKLESVNLTTTSCSVMEGTTASIELTYSPSNYDATKAAVVWASSNTSIATVSSNTIRGIKPGTATITATITADGQVHEKRCTVKVTADPEKVTGISISNKTMDPRTTYAIPITVTPSTADLVTGLSWSSSNSKVATINDNGVVTAHRGGTTTINLSTTVDKVKLTASCTITVTPRKGIYIKDKFYVPYVFHNGRWRRSSLSMWKDKNWKKFIEDTSKNS